MTQKLRRGSRGTGLKTQADKLARRLFRQAARAQRVCQNPACTTPTAAWSAHHVVYEQDLRRLGLPIYDTRNAMRLCRDCHGQHHSRAAPIPVAVLTTNHIEYAREVFGDAYVDYLHRRYIPEMT